MSFSSAPPMARYRIDSVLGSGGMAVVSAAFDFVRNHEVALKRLALDKFPASREREQAVAFFEREYYTLTQLAHPRIIEVYDYGLDGEGPYYTMERLEGRSLRRDVPLDIRTACSLIRDVASALAIVHSRRLVHRDVTPLNIHVAPDGRAKLIDFGAMTPMGIGKGLVGTPAFVAPECTAFQALDERTDLYSLGACLYFALTGRYAYSAKNFRGLDEAWGCALAPPSRFVAGIPESLEQLVLSLLSLSPAGRPTTAAEVFERLTVIADLPPGEPIEVARAYVTSPTLVGRDGDRAALRRRALRAARGRGRSVLIEGAAGVGRSALLDAAVLEAKLSGLRVVRADASDGLAPFGVARALLREVCASSQSARNRSEELGYADWTVANIGAALDENREKLFSHACTLFLDACASHGTAIAVDDLHLIDEPSLALLASLAAQVRKHRLLLLGTLRSDAVCSAPAAMTLLSDSSVHLRIGALGESSCRELVSSVLGEVPGIDTLGAVTYARCSGNPRELMDSLQALIDQRLLRYEGGGWLITGDPEAIESALPPGGFAKQQLERLSPDAAELLSILALDRGVLLGLADYASLTLHGEAARVNKALDELIHARLILHAEGRYPFAREAPREAVVESLAEARRRELHRRLAERLASLQVPRVYEAYHFLKAGLPLAAIEPIEAYRDFVEANPSAAILRNAINMDALEEIVALPEQAGPIAALRAEHGAGLILNAMYRGWPERAFPHARKVLDELSWFTGLADYHKLATLEGPARLGKAMELSRARCAATGFASLNPITAVRRLSQASVATAICARSLADASLFRAIPDLTPFVPFSPAIGFLAALVDGLGKLIRGQEWDAWDTIENVYRDLLGDVGEQIDPLTRMGLEGVALGYLCALEAEHASPTAITHIDEYAPFMPNLAESHRARYRLAIGDAVGATVARRRSEVLSVQANGLADARILELPAYLTHYALADDVMGIKRTLDALEQVVRTRPFWEPRLALARCHLARCRGETEEALAIIEPSLSGLDRESAEWAPSAAVHLDLLNHAKRFEDARRVGLDYREHARAFRVPAVRIDLALALSCAELGDAAAAEGHFEAAYQALNARGVGGTHLGHCYEMGARIALCRQDHETFAARARACANLYCERENPALTAKYRVLMAYAARCGYLAEADLRAPADAERAPSEIASSPSEGISTSIGKSESRTQPPPADAVANTRLTAS